MHIRPAGLPFCLKRSEATKCSPARLLPSRGSVPPSPSFSLVHSRWCAQYLLHLRSVGLPGIGPGLSRPFIFGRTTRNRTGTIPTPRVRTTTIRWSGKNFVAFPKGRDVLPLYDSPFIQHHFSGCWKSGAGFIFNYKHNIKSSVLHRGFKI